MIRLPQLLITAMSVGSILLSGAIVQPVNAGALPIAAVPMAPVSSQSGTGSCVDVSHKLAAKKKARIARAAICTEDLTHISFSEYTCDWSAWMSQVAYRWSQGFNAAYASGKFRPDGPAFVQFTCNADGSVSDVRLVSGSGDGGCDRDQVESLKNCVPLPKFPEGCKKKSVTLLYVWDYGVDFRTAIKQQRKSPARHTQILDSRISISGKTM